MLSHAQQGLQEAHLFISFQLHTKTKRRFRLWRRCLTNIRRISRRKWSKQHIEHLCFGFGFHNWEKVWVPSKRSTINETEQCKQVHGVDRQLQRVHSLRMGLSDGKIKGIKLHFGQTQRYRNNVTTKIRTTFGIRHSRPWPNPFLGIQQRLKAVILRCVYQIRWRRRRSWGGKSWADCLWLP